MEIEVGEYIRTKNGFIRKVGEIDRCQECNEKIYISVDIIDGLHFERSWHLKEIVSHSKNIIDLIQVGDFVNGMRVIATENRGRYNEEKQKDEKVILAENYDEWTENGVISNEDIKTILTKEQYEQNSFKL